MKIIKKSLALLLSILVLMSIFPLTVFAIEQDVLPESEQVDATIIAETKPSDVEGLTPEDPIPEDPAPELEDLAEAEDISLTPDTIVDPAALQSAVVEPAMTGITALASPIAWTTYGRAGHSSVNGDSVAFYGHPQVPFTSLLYCSASDGDYRYLTFHLTEGNSDWHTLEGTGFLFNAGISNGLLNGYAVLFGQATVGFYKLTNVSISTLAAATFTAVPGVSLLDQKAKPTYSQGTTWFLKLIMSPGTLKVEKYSDTGFSQLSETIFSTTLNDTSAGTGYGPFASFIAHDCSSISTSTMEYFNLEIKPNTPPTIAAPDVIIPRGSAFDRMDNVRANDTEDRDLSSSVSVVSSNVNINIPGVYQVVYAVSDLAGASINHTRKVTVLADVLFQVVDISSQAPIPGVGISFAATGVTLSDTDGSGKTSAAIVHPGAYEWQVSKQHDDYLPLLGTFTAQVDSTASDTWPMIIPVELTKKYHDVGVELSLTRIGDVAAVERDMAKYNQVAVFTMAITNHSNQSVIPAIELKPRNGMELLIEPLYTGIALEPGDVELVEIECKVTSLMDTQDAELEIVIASLALAADLASVPDENDENDRAIAGLKIKNMPLVFTKTDALDKKPLDGVELQILMDDTPLKFKQLESGSWLVDESGFAALLTVDGGKITVYGLEPGKYAIKEAKQLPGFVLPVSTWSFEVDADGGLVDDVEMKNAPTELVIEKTDASTGKRVDGAVFKLTDAAGKAISLTRQTDGTYRPDPSGKESFITENGIATIRYLPVGKLTLTEITAPPGYSPSKPLQLEITGNHGLGSPLSVKVANTPLAVLIKKTARGGAALSGAGFSINLKDNSSPVTFTQDSSGVFRYDPAGPIKTIMVNASGEILIYGIPAGEYILDEVVVPDGYVHAVPKTIKVSDEHTADKPLEISVINEPIVKLGFDTDKWLLPLAVGLLVAAAATCIAFLLYYKKRMKADNA